MLELAFFFLFAKTNNFFLLNGKLSDSHYNNKALIFIFYFLFFTTTKKAILLQKPLIGPGQPHNLTHPPRSSPWENQLKIASHPKGKVLVLRYLLSIYKLKLVHAKCRLVFLCYLV